MSNKLFGEPSGGLIKNGYFYTFQYLAPTTKANDSGYDSAPFIFCIGPSEHYKNNFIGLNLHHVTVKDRVKLFTELADKYDILHKSSRTVLSETTLNSLVPGILAGVREYNRTRVLNPLFVPNDVAPLFYSAQGDIRNAKTNDMLIRYLNETHDYK